MSVRGIASGRPFALPNPSAWLGRVRPGVARGATGPIGFEIGTHGLYFAQLAAARGGVTLRAASHLGLAHEDDSLFTEPGRKKREIARVLSEGGFRGRKAIGCLHSPDVKLMVLDYSAASDAEEPAAIVRLVAERMDEAPSELVIDYQPIRALGESAHQRSALVAVARRAPVVDRLEALRKAGLQIQALEIAPVAIRRLVGVLAGEKHAQENALVLYAGRRRGHLSVLWGRRLVLYRELDFGEATVVERVQKALDLSSADASALVREHGVQPPAPDEAPRADAATAQEIGAAALDILKPGFYALAEQIDRARVYTASKAHGASPDRAYLLGAFAQWPRADRLLASLADLPTSTLDPKGLIEASAGPSLSKAMTAAAGPEMTLAVGLALRGMRHDG